MKGGPTILLVEDEWFIRIAFAEHLLTAGFDVFEAGTAEDALKALNERAGSVAAIVTDVRLIGPLDGIALVQLAARLWPWIKLLVISGEAPHRLALAPSNCSVIRKPVGPEQIVIEVRTLLGG